MYITCLYTVCLIWNGLTCKVLLNSIYCRLKTYCQEFKIMGGGYLVCQVFGSPFLFSGRRFANIEQWRMKPRRFGVLRTSLYKIECTFLLRIISDKNISNMRKTYFGLSGYGPIDNWFTVGIKTGHLLLNDIATGKFVGIWPPRGLGLLVPSKRALTSWRANRETYFQRFLVQSRRNRKLQWGWRWDTTRKSCSHIRKRKDSFLASRGARNVPTTGTKLVAVYAVNRWAKQYCWWWPRHVYFCAAFPMNHCLLLWIILHCFRGAKCNIFLLE